MEITMKNYYHFSFLKDELGGDLINPSSWDTLRTRNSGGAQPFFVHEDRESWEKACLANESLRLRAKRITEILNSKYRLVRSFGVGTAYLEFLINKENGFYDIECFDYAPKNIARLKNVFFEASSISRFDMLNDEWQGMGGEGVCLLHRVDTEFSDQQWRWVFGKIRSAGITNILFIPSELLTPYKILRRVLKRIVSFILGRRMTFCGYVRTEQRLVRLMSEHFDIKQTLEIHDLKGYWLVPKRDDHEAGT